jgi:hypothetical protein
MENNDVFQYYKPERAVAWTGLLMEEVWRSGQILGIF